MKLQFIKKWILLFGGALMMMYCQRNEPKETTFLMGNGIGVNNVTLMVKEIDSALKYYKDTLGFTIRTTPKAGSLAGTKTAHLYLGDMSSFEFLSIDDSLQNNFTEGFVQSFLSANQGVRLYSLSSSSVDSTFNDLTKRGFLVDSIQFYQSNSEPPDGWAGDHPKRKSLDFDRANPPASLPRFIEKIDYGYEDVKKEWNTYYVFRRMYMAAHPNGVVGINAVRVLVSDLKAKSQEFQSMGFELLEESDGLVRFKLYRQQELHLIAATNPEHHDFLSKRGEGVFAMRFDVIDLDSTQSYLSKELPKYAMNKSPELLKINSAYAFGVQLEFIQEAKEQSILAKTYSPSRPLDSLAIAHTSKLYTKYCALCHGNEREGYAADNAPSLRSKSLLATSMNNNFMRYTIQYGRSNTAMAGYLDSQGGPLEYIEIELILQWLNELADVEEPVKLSRDPIVGDLELGAQIYDKQCALCHGKNGEGVSAPALGNPMTLATATDHFLRYAVAEGRDGTPMVAYKDTLTEEEINGVVAFLRSRSSGWDIPDPIPVSIPTPDEYIINPDGADPVFDLREGKYASADQVNEAFLSGKRMIILDARSEVAWRQMHIPGAIPVPYYEDPENFIDDIPNDGTQIVIYCACPHAASGRVQSTLRRNGFENTAIIDEGILVWAQRGYPVRSGN